ncbi:MAG: AAA family ATPase, partial [Gemmataceae bacterium]|nr:AAA family ATPase [Gemmataceae bacterium]
MFKRMTLAGWRQFGEVDIAFHPRLTVITGTNGAGKSTILSLLATTLPFSGNRPFLTTKAAAEPGYDPDAWDADLRWFAWMLAAEPTENAEARLERALEALRVRIDGYARDRQERLLQAAQELADRWRRSRTFGRLTTDPDKRDKQIGVIEFGTGFTWPLTVPMNVSNRYSLGSLTTDRHTGFHIPSHRALYAYHSEATLPLSPPTRQDMFSRFASRMYGSEPNRHDPIPHNFRLKEALIALAFCGFGSEVVQPDPAARKLFDEFNEILRGFLPPKLGFQRFHIRPPEIVLLTRSGEFS